MNHYPPLRAAVLTALRDLKKNLEVLDSPECPYDPETISILKEILAPTFIEKVVEKEVTVEATRGRGRPSKDIQLNEEDQQKVLDGIRETLEELNHLGTGNLETSERIQVAKTKTGLIDQLLKMRERNSTAQKMEEFKETVISILNDLIDEKDREIFMRRLEPYR